MRRMCDMCKNHYNYKVVKRWKPTGYQICTECQEMISEICRVKWLQEW